MGYWALAAVLVFVGYLGLFTIGLPLLLFGTALAILYPVRRRREVFWPSLGGLGAFILGYVLVAPLGCTTTAIETSAGVGPSHVTCTTLLGNLLGLRYSRPAPYSPSLLPAIIVALAFGLVAGVGLHLLLRSRSHRPRGLRQRD